MTKLKGQVAIVTGASRGIGLAIAEELARAGCQVMLTARSRAALDQNVDRICRELGPVAWARVTDMADGEQVRDLVAETEAQLGGLDIFVNNAGLGIYGGIDEVDMGDLRYVFEVNFFGAVAGMQWAAAAMRRRGGGTIVNISSILGHFAQPLGGGYSATKHALQAVSQAAQAELARDKIHVLVVCPGLTETEFARYSRVSVPGAGAAAGESHAPMRGVSPTRVARRTLTGIRRRERQVFISWTDRAVILVAQALPGPFAWALRQIARYRRRRFAQRNNLNP